MIPLRPRARPPSRLKTFSHLAGARRMPNEYELVSTGLHHHAKGFEIDLPLGDWYARYQRGSALACDDWDAFVDPRQTTYAKYTALAHARETFIDGILEQIEATRYDARLTPSWIATLARAFAPLRYPFHALQMIAAYVGSMAPGGRITITCALQAADEMRRVQRVAYRMTQIAQTHPGFGDESKAAWLTDEAWQPLRELVERLLVTFDWGEALVALNVCAKPLLDEVVLVHLPRAAAASGDPMLGSIAFSLHEDALWQRAWTASLVRMLSAASASNAAAMREWTSTWAPRARRAALAYATLASPDAGGALDAFFADHLTSLGLETP